MNTEQFLLTAWVWSPLALVGTAAALRAYFQRFGWSRRAWWMVAAAALLLLTLTSPLATLARGYLFSAHMLQHILLVLAVPAFALMALPDSAQITAPLARLLNPAFCWASGVGAMWIWHAPALCNAAATSRPVSDVQTLSLLALGAAFWWPLLAPRETQRIAPLRAVVYLFAACTACTILGIILTFSPVTVCRAYVHPVDRLGLLPMIYGAWAMTPPRDQQIGGLIMWVPMCLVYLCAIFAQLARWYTVPAEPTLQTS
jgi:cytochrome c oxidase assembly factor CtaG